MSSAAAGGSVVATVRSVTHRPAGRPRPGHDGAPVLDAVSLDVRAGEVLALSGRSGSGKSTLCHLLAGLVRPTSGEVRVGGAPAHRVRDWRQVSLLPQRLGLAEELTVAESIQWPCRLLGRPVPRDLMAALALEPLAQRPVGEASLGEQQRTGLARALATGPRLAVLDEPTGHQDDAGVVRVLAVLAAASAAGTAVVVATHDTRVLDAADRVLALSAGRLDHPLTRDRRSSAHRGG